jgi:hypothetical protein
MDFCQDASVTDDVNIPVVKCDFERPHPAKEYLLAARRAGALGVGLLSREYGREELERAGAYRVYNDPADLLWHLDELGVLREG